MNKSAKRVANLKYLGIPESVTVTVDLIYGSTYLKVRNQYGVNGVKTLPDVLPGVHIDADKFEIIGLEDISADMAKTADRWVKALLIAKKKLDG